MSPSNTKLHGLLQNSLSRRRMIGVSAAMGFAALTGVAAQDATPEAVGTPEGTAEAILASPVAVAQEALPYLFIQTSAAGSWTPVRGQPGAFWLSLSDPSPQTIVVRDEPTDAAGTISTALFFDSIRIQRDVPMQAVISAETPTGQDDLVVSLHRAEYGASIGELVYVATKLDDYDDQHGIVPLTGQTSNFTLPPSFGATTLFITNAYCRTADGSTCDFG